MKKLILVGVAAVSAAMFALPAVASAGMWQMDPAGAAFNFTGIGSITWTTAFRTLGCNGWKGSGSYKAESTTEGTIELTFTGCIDHTTETYCTSPGSKLKGEITTTTLTFKNVYLEPEAMTPGLTIKGAEGGSPAEHFATFSCAFMGGVVTGTVLIQLEEPAKFCNTESTKIPLVFESTAPGVQKWEQVTTTGEKEDLSSTLFGQTETRSLDGTGIVERATGLKPTCPATE